ncbi:hypothetical protein CE91St46_07890 [Eubacteriales bacterium]|nr:hypothetical protein [Faecalicatena sp. BF-R-105]GKH49678.1 hypothetical protein CE91St46_07890 [Eubacteriales bacterium]GKH62319.1 hypothetical protein CE91St47_07880 [Eubacteriales bacterium]
MTSNAMLFVLIAVTIAFSAFFYMLKKMPELDYMDDEERRKYHKNLWIAALVGWIFMIIAFISD